LLKAVAVVPRYKRAPRQTEHHSAAQQKSLIKRMHFERLSRFKNSRWHMLRPLLAKKCKHRLERSFNAYVLELDQIKTKD
jgi:hypothetical protein